MAVSMMFLCAVSLLCLAAIRPATSSTATVVLISALVSAKMCGSNPRFTSSVTRSSTVTAKNTTTEKIQITQRAVRSFFDRVRLIFFLLFEKNDQEYSAENGYSKYDSDPFQLAFKCRFLMLVFLEG